MYDNFDDFESEIYTDLNWRKTEVQNFYKEVKYPTTDSLILEQVEKAFRKSLILLIYSHWEGFVKRTSKHYLKYISNKEIPSKNLTKNFHVLVMKGNFFSASNEIKSSDKNSLSMEIYSKIVKDYSENMENKFFLNIDMSKEKDSSVIDTNSNLTSAVYKNVFNCLGIKFYPCFELPPESSFLQAGNYNPEILKQILDFTLLNSRNHIAHGNKNDPSMLMELDKLEVLRDLVFQLMDNFADTILTFTEKEFFLEEKILEADSHINVVNQTLIQGLNNKINSYVDQLVYESEE